MGQRRRLSFVVVERVEFHGWLDDEHAMLALVPPGVEQFGGKLGVLMTPERLREAAELLTALLAAVEAHQRREHAEALT